MTLQQVAERAGVSASTVSRVLNSMPGITPDTARSVRNAVKALSYLPEPRRNSPIRPRQEQMNGTRVAFAVLDLAGPRSVPKYDQLIRGVSMAAARFGLDLQMTFMSDLDEAITRLTSSGFKGLILHGSCPPCDKSQPLHSIPTVWLMGNPRRPHWGDQVMPDNATVGRLAAKYLLDRGHRHVMYFGMRSGWSLATRSLAFQQDIEDAGGSVTVINHPVLSVDKVGPEEFDAALARLSEMYRSLPQRPTGLFVAEDWMIRAVYSTLEGMNVHLGEGGMEVVSCNNDRAHLIGVSPMPATIDIRAEGLGAHAVEQLVQRIRSGGLNDRVRIMLEPELVLPAGN